MTESLVSVVWGVGLGLCYGASSYLMFLWAMKKDDSRFYVIALGGMLVRMIVAFTAVAVITRLLGIAEQPFFLGFVSTFAIALSVEVGAMHKGVGVSTRSPQSGSVV